MASLDMSSLPPVRSSLPTTYRAEDDAWEFDIVGIYEGAKKITDTSSFFFRYDYFDEGRADGEGLVGWYYVRVNDPEHAEDVARAIDAEFANSPAETKAEPEGAFAQGFVKRALGASTLAQRPAVGERVAGLIVQNDADISRARTALDLICVGEILIDHETRTLTAPVDGGADALREALQKLHTAKVPVVDVGLRRPTLDDVFLTLTGHVAGNGKPKTTEPENTTEEATR